MIFGIITLIILLALLIFAYWRIKKNNRSLTEALDAIKSDMSSGLKALRNLSLKDKNFLNISRDFLFSTSLILLSLMAVSGFVLPLFWQPTDGVLLFIHVFIAPFFAVSVTLSVALFANRMQFNKQDNDYLFSNRKQVLQKILFWKKVNFWLFSVSVIFNIASIVLAMYPLFGTSGQNTLINIHRYSALVLLVVSINYLTLKYSLKSK